MARGSAAVSSVLLYPSHRCVLTIVFIRSFRLALPRPRLPPAACTSVCATTAPTDGYNTKAAAHSQRTVPSAQRKSHRLHAFMCEDGPLGLLARAAPLLSALAPLFFPSLHCRCVFILHPNHISHCVSLMFRLFSEIGDQFESVGMGDAVAAVLNGDSGLPPLSGHSDRQWAANNTI